MVPGLGEAEKGGTDELVAGKNPEYCTLQRKSWGLCPEILKFMSLLAGVIASKDSLVSPHKIKPYSG